MIKDINIEPCASCVLRDVGEAVQGHGPSPCRLMVVGEAPGREEVERGQPFVGGAGRVRDALFASGGLSGQPEYVTNAVKCRPPNNDISLYRGAIQSCSRFLREELNTVRPEVVVALGGSALESLTGREGITKHRGSIIYKVAESRRPVEEDRGAEASDMQGRQGGKPDRPRDNDSRVGVCTRIIPTIHPAALMRDQVMWPVVVADLRRVAEELRYDAGPPVEHYLVNPSFEEALAWLRATTTGPIAIDVETGYGAILSVGLARSYEEALCIPLCSEGLENYWPVQDEIILVEEIARILADPFISKVMQNASYDIGELEACGFAIGGRVWDTMLMHHCIAPGLPHDLGFLASVYTRTPYYKNMWKAATEEWGK